MARPSQNLDEKLLKAGRAFIQSEGLGKLSLRAVAKKAGVNLGMFHYHFKNKADFASRCMGTSYAEFYKGFEIETSSEGTTLERLRRGLHALGRFSRDNRFFMLALMRDLEDKNPEAWAFIKAKFPPAHGRVIMNLIKQGQKEGVLIKVPPTVAMSSIMGAISMSNLMGGLAERVVGTKMLSLPKLAIRHYFLSDEALSARVELALRSLTKHPDAELPRRKK